MYNYKFFKIYRLIIFFFIVNPLYITQYIPSIIAVSAITSKINTLEQQQERIAQLCAAQQSCSSCLQTPTCIWCAAVMDREKNIEPSVRCITRSKFNEHWCPGDSSLIVNDTSSIIIEKDIPLSSVKSKEPVQIRPQKIKLRLRKGEEYRFKIKYTQAEDYPVDMYYLMDLSASMQPYRQHLSELGANLASVMRNLTSNFRLGFGSFVDKVTLPMTDTQPIKLKKPCDFIEDNKKTDCASPYGYKHQMSLTEDSDSFRSNVRAAPISGNLDGPEGGLDAIMQSIVCTKRIGWRQKARHLLVFSSDASFHLAGDGKLAGIIEPNDCQCHLDSKGFYSHSLLQDYPSISQINKKVGQHNIHIIFAVPSTRNHTYQLLSQSISGSAIGLVEKNDTVNVINLIKKEYEKLVESVKMTDNAPKHINVKYFSKCLNKVGDDNDNIELKQQSKCQGLRFGDVVEFEIVIKAIECPSSSFKQNKFEIKPEGLNESLIIEYQVICTCPCDKPGHSGFKAKAEECNFSGSLVCGVCSCNNNFYGQYCDCHNDRNIVNKDNNNNNNNNGQVSNENNKVIIKEDCRTSANDTVNCSGHGTCKCGICECHVRPNPLEKFSGKYCECNNFSCKRNGRLLCGGHGDCVCGTCDCYPGWSGESCDCHDNTTCFPPGKNTKICNGHGDCICGRCHCKLENDVLYSGSYCQDCPTCPGLHCDKLKDCVECLVYNTNSYDQVEDDSLINTGCYNYCHDEINIEKIDKVQINSTEHEAGIRMCRVPTNDSCTFVFKYQLVSNRGDISLFKITAQEIKDCPGVLSPIPVFGVAIGVILSTVIVGFLILMIWKILTIVHDHREFAKFEKERAMAKWERGDNPLYKQATTTFSNPTFVEMVYAHKSICVSCHLF
ncbi:integrin beta-PS-like isoform X1 [Microplitis mediator]|uniref:integrin beta-PS-like isoform X1 n=1 Tax=Microplitis mediator TaxID=375433 RepID=UPI0025536590|nr:integrin beta-PS-like isoform X1 [Microplitis mediator]